MNSSINLYLMVVFFIISLFAAYFAFNLIFKVKNVTEERENIILCKDIKEIYNSGNNTTIIGYLPENCTLNNISIPAGKRFIKIVNGEIYYT